jgi:hypothetical protein
MPAAAIVMRVLGPSVPDSRPLGGRELIHDLLMCRIPWWQGKMQGISPVRPFSAEIRLENICEFSDLRMNSLCDRAGNSFARAGN